jgi:uncharacterized membrane protein
VPSAGRRPALAGRWQAAIRVAMQGGQDGRPEKPRGACLPEGEVASGRLAIPHRVPRLRGGSRVVVGALLLVFGLQWLRKAILRASGHKALHDEDRIYAEQVTKGSTQAVRRIGLVSDWYAFTQSFKGVLLEGLEVVFIVLTFGSNQHDVGLAVIAAACTVVLVAGIGVLVRAPLARVPENTLKFLVGIMLTSLGVLWGAEGAGARWPGSDAALLVLIPAVSIVAGLAATYLLSRAGIAAWWLLPAVIAVLLPACGGRSGTASASGAVRPSGRPPVSRR